jgi:cytohesin
MALSVLFSCINGLIFNTPDETALNNAIIANDLDAVKFCIASGVEFGRAPINTAIKYGRGEIFQLFLERLDPNTNVIQFYLSYALEMSNAPESTVKVLLDKKFLSITSRTERGTPLMSAVIERGHVKLMILLLDYGISVNGPIGEDSDEFNPLVKAVCSHQLQAAQVLIERGVDLEQKLYQEMTVLQYVATGSVHNRTEETADKDDQIFQLLVTSGANIEIADNDNYTPLMHVLENVNLVRILVNQGANKEVVTYEEKLTPLLGAIQKGYHKTVEFLLDSGSNINAKAKDGNGAVTIAAETKDTKMVGILLDRGANIEMTNKYEKTPLLAMIENGKHYLDMIKFLLSRGANVEARDEDNNTPLINAALKSDANIMRVLLDHGADINATGTFEKDKEMTPLMICSYISKYANEDCMELLIERGADLEARNSKGYTALLLAGKRNADDHVRLLLKAGSNVHVVTKKGKDIREIAGKHDDSWRLIEKHLN